MEEEWGAVGVDGVLCLPNVIMVGFGDSDMDFWLRVGMEGVDFVAAIWMDDVAMFTTDERWRL